MKFGVRDGVLRQSWEDSFGEAAWLGFDGVELDVGANWEGTLLWSEDGRRRLRQMQAGSGVELASFCVGGLWTDSPADENPEVRLRAIRFIREAAQHAREVDCGLILVPITPGREGSGQTSPETQRSRWIEALRECASAAAAAEVMLALENVGRGCGQSAPALIEIIQGVDSSWVQAYYDFGNAILLGQQPIEELKLLAPYIRRLHAKDPGGNRLGTGRVPFAAVVDEVRRIGYDGYIVLETDPTDQPAEAAAANLHYLQEVFA